VIDLMTSDTEKVSLLRKQIADIKKNWPAHSVSPALMQQLDELEEALEQALREDEGSEDESPTPSDTHP
jgi:L-lactate utilization protein LutB